MRINRCSSQVASYRGYSQIDSGARRAGEVRGAGGASAGSRSRNANPNNHWCLRTKHSFCPSLCLTTQQQKVPSSSRFGVHSQASSSPEEILFHRHRQLRPLPHLAPNQTCSSHCANTSSDTTGALICFLWPRRRIAVKTTNCMQFLKGPHTDTSPCQCPPKRSQIGVQVYPFLFCLSWHLGC